MNINTRFTAVFVYLYICIFCIFVYIERNSPLLLFEFCFKNIKKG
jgi:hypothetical protein